MKDYKFKWALTSGAENTSSEVKMMIEQSIQERIRKDGLEGELHLINRVMISIKMRAVLQINHHMKEIIIEGLENKI